MRYALLTVALLSVLGGLNSCGQDKPARKEPQFGLEPRGPHHDYSLTWVYAVGEVEAPSANDCKKAFEFVDADAECIGTACKYANDLVSDLEFACKKVGSQEQLGRVKELGVTLATRARQSPTECTRQMDDFLSRGCGAEGACAPVVQQWAARCAEQTKSPLARHVLERLVENSYQESHRVKLDARSCSELGEQLASAANCNKPFDCEDALPQADVYLARCAEGPRKALAVAQAAQISHMRLVAAKTVTPLALTDTKPKMVSLPGSLTFAEGTGAVVRVCGEAVADLADYLTQRKSCQNGELEFLTVADNGEGPSLELQKRWHDSDASFSAALPKLFVDGEANARAQEAIAEFASALAALPQRAADDFANAFEQTNEAYATVAPNLRQSERLYQALTRHDEALTTLFGLIGEQKVLIASKRVDDKDLIAFARRAKKYVFSDITRQGSVELGKSSELSELVLERVLPKAFSSYGSQLKKLDALLAKRRLKLAIAPGNINEDLAAYGQACSVAHDRLKAAREKLERCSSSADACTSEERTQRASLLRNARSELSAARVKEILAKASLGKQGEPSAACASW